MLSVAIIFKVILHPFLSSEKDITKDEECWEPNHIWACWLFSKYLLSCSREEKKSYSCATTWAWV